jgi:hypothetical protein
MFREPLFGVGREGLTEVGGLEWRVVAVLHGYHIYLVLQLKKIILFI